MSDDLTAISHMKVAIEAMRTSTIGTPQVGAAVVVGGKVVAIGQRQSDKHAERAAIDAAVEGGADLCGATLFTTLEPCVRLSSTQESCAELIVRSKIAAVYIGSYDTNPDIYRRGWKHLRDAEIDVRDFDGVVRSEIETVNQQFIEHFTRGIGPSGGAKIDYTLNGGNFEIQFSPTDNRSILTRWTHRGAGSIYAYATLPVQVALARYASSFEEIDDPKALSFSYTVPVEVGEIAAFVSPNGSVLVQIKEIEAGPSGGAAARFVKIKYQVRPRGV
jgi:diaminohydroxyphosphoribosylaminopyrimidine deaminase/5-amino-6-(5-phosphoribosylamino)uracil reductase